jgi:hypothetical protein
MRLGRMDSGEPLVLKPAPVEDPQNQEGEQWR